MQKAQQSQLINVSLPQRRDKFIQTKGMQGQGAERNSLIIKIDHKTLSSQEFSAVKQRRRELTFTEYNSKPDVLLNVNTRSRTLEKRDINSANSTRIKLPLLQIGKLRSQSPLQRKKKKQVVKQEIDSPVELIMPVKFQFAPRRKSETKWARFAICDELLEIWDIFHEQHWQSKKTSLLLQTVMEIPKFFNITVLALEDKGIEQIFQYIQPCQQLQALFLKNNRIITRDLHFMSMLKRLKKLDLSNNGIHFLPEEYQLERLQKLEFLLLHQNQIVGWGQIELLTCLKHLRHLTMHGNPCSKVLGYRKFLIECMPHLRCLDEFIVGDLERADLSKKYPASTFRGEKLRQLKRFRPHNPQTQSYFSLAFKFSEQQDQEHSEFKYSYNAEEASKHIQWEHYLLRRKFEWCSPILTIQKTARMYLAKKHYKKIRRQIQIVYWCFNRMKLRTCLLKFIYKLGLTPQMLFMIGKVRLIQKRWRAYVKNKQRRIQVTDRLQSIFRMQKVQNQSFIDALDLKVNDTSHTSNRLVFTKKDLSICDRLGLIQYFVECRQLKNVALKLNAIFDKEEHRQSPLLSLIKASYRMVRIIEQPKESNGKSAIEAFGKFLIPSGLSKLQPTLKPRMLKRKKKVSQLEDLNMITKNNALVAVSFANDAVLTTVFQKIMKYNRTHDNILIVFYEKFVNEFRARIQIQKWIKGTLLRQNQKIIFQNGKLQLKSGVQPAKLTVDNTIYGHFALVMRAVRKIQHTFRIWRIKMRINCLAKIAHYAAAIDSNVIYMNENIYIHLTQIQAACKPVSEQSRSFYERNFNFQLLSKDFNTKVNFPLHQDSTGRYIQNNFPKWFQAILGCQVPQLVAQKFQIARAKPVEKSGTQIEKTANTLIHTCLNEPSVVSLSNFYEVEIDLNLVKIEVNNIVEARIRAILIALLTCKFLSGSDCFAKLFTFEQLSYHKKIILNTNLVLSACKIQNPTNYQPLKDQLHLMQHGGIINKRQDVYRNILRSRPRYSKKNYDRFIVLSDANALIVEQRIGEAMAKNQLSTKQKQKQVIVEKAPIIQAKGDLTLKQGLTPNARAKQSILIAAQTSLKRESIRNLAQGQGSTLDSTQHRLQEQRKLINLIEVIKQKRSKLEKKIEHMSFEDLTFRTVYTQQMVPQINQFKQQTNIDTNGTSQKAIIFTMPNEDDESADQNMPKSIEQLIKEVEQLKKIYKEQKAAFKKAVVIRSGQDIEKVTLYSKAQRNSYFEQKNQVKRKTEVAGQFKSELQNDQIARNQVEQPSKKFDTLKDLQEGLKIPFQEDSENISDRILNAEQSSSVDYNDSSRRVNRDSSRKVKRMVKIKQMNDEDFTQEFRLHTNKMNKSLTQATIKTQKEIQTIRAYQQVNRHSSYAKTSSSYEESSSSSISSVHSDNPEVDEIMHTFNKRAVKMRMIMPQNPLARDSESLVERVQQQIHFINRIKAPGLVQKSQPLNKLLTQDKVQIKMPQLNLQKDIKDQTMNYYLNAQKMIDNKNLQPQKKELEIVSQKFEGLNRVRILPDLAQECSNSKRERQDHQSVIKSHESQDRRGWKPKSPQFKGKDLEFQLITKSLMPSASQLISHDIPLKVSSPLDRKRQQLNVVSERVKNNQVTPKIRMSLFAPLSHQITTANSKIQIQGVGQNQQKQKPIFMMARKNNKNTLESILRSRRILGPNNENADSFLADETSPIHTQLPHFDKSKSTAKLPSASVERVSWDVSEMQKRYRAPQSFRVVLPYLRKSSMTMNRGSQFNILNKIK